MRTPEIFADQLKGKKILIIGNHDYRGEVVKCFAEVHNYLEIEIGGNKVHMSHYPYKENVGPHDGKFLHKMMKDDGNWLLHGHVHNSAPQIVDKSINCSVEMWDYVPIPETKIEEIMKGKA
jgi:calcineurin-like phosphoesterase family protein